MSWDHVEIPLEIIERHLREGSGCVGSGPQAWAAYGGDKFHFCSGVVKGNPATRDAKAVLERLARRRAFFAACKARGKRVRAAAEGAAEKMPLAVFKTLSRTAIRWLQEEADETKQLARFGKFYFSFLECFSEGAHGENAVADAVFDWREQRRESYRERGTLAANAERTGEESGGATLRESGKVAPPKGNAKVAPPKGNGKVAPPKGNGKVAPPKGNGKVAPPKYRNIVKSKEIVYRNEEEKFNPDKPETKPGGGIRVGAGAHVGRSRVGGGGNAGRGGQSGIGFSGFQKTGGFAEKEAGGKAVLPGRRGGERGARTRAAMEEAAEEREAVAEAVQNPGEGVWTVEERHLPAFCAEVTGDRDAVRGAWGYRKTLQGFRAKYGAAKGVCKFREIVHGFLGMSRDGELETVRSKGAFLMSRLAEWL